MQQDLQELWNGIVKNLADFNTEARSFVEKGNKAAGRRSRKATLELEKLFKQWRKLSVSATLGKNESTEAAE